MISPAFPEAGDPSARGPTRGCGSIGFVTLIGISSRGSCRANRRCAADTSEKIRERDLQSGPTRSWTADDAGRNFRAGRRGATLSCATSSVLWHRERLFIGQGVRAHARARALDVATIIQRAYRSARVNANRASPRIANNNERSRGIGPASGVNKGRVRSALTAKQAAKSGQGHLSRAIYSLARRGSSREARRGGAPFTPPSRSIGWVPLSRWGRKISSARSFGLSRREANRSSGTIQSAIIIRSFVWIA